MSEREETCTNSCSSDHHGSHDKTTDATDKTSSVYWSIGVKTVTSSVPANDFVVRVSPDDDLEQLYNEIETKTGLSASQQRLIYRGRLIEFGNNNNNNNNNASSKNQRSKNNSPSSPTTPDDNNNNHNINTPKAEDGSDSPNGSETPSNKKIKDIAGLTDGHTIHLVERKVQQGRSSARDNNNTSPLSVSAAASPTETSTLESQQVASNEATDTNNDSSASSGAASLLAALLGMGSGESASGRTNNDGDDDDDADAATSTNTSRTRWRPRYASTRRRHLSYRLTEEDLQVPDPGSMESVRQGLLTLHTLLGPVTTNGTESAASRGIASGHNQQQPVHIPHHKSPLDAQRRFYQGQWIDLRDTVNQWLEATVVDIVLPEQILPPPIANRRNKKNRPTVLPASDPAVSAGDFAGRRRLLLELCSEEDHEPNLGIELDGNGDPVYFRQRESNASVQLLLVHYNGWPHRWDEWIRSDSERIRPFRTRTRHPNTSNRISPTVQSPFSEAPQTYFLQNRTHEGRRREQEDRNALLPELSRVVAAVNGLLANAASSNGPVRVHADTRTPNNTHLPWDTVSAPVERDNAIMEVDEEDDDQERKEPNSEEVATKVDDDQKVTTVSTSTCGVSARRRRQELELLAPLLDRLGRTLVDAAPHVAALASSIDQPVPESIVREQTNATDDERPRPSTLGGFLSLLSRDRNRTSVGSSNAAILGTDSVSFANSHEQATVASSSIREDDDDCDDDASDDVQFDPDYTDFAAGLVNTTRGDVRGGGHRSSRQASSGNTGDELAGLLGAYLAAASLGGLMSSNDDDDADNATAQGLGRLLRDRGAGGNGIDIHIHAVVTAPGGNVGLATVGGGGGGLGTALFQSSSRGSSTRSQNVSVPPARDPQELQVEDDLGIFAELYSETPDPIDPASPTNSSSPSSSNGLQSPSIRNIDSTSPIADEENVNSTNADSRPPSLLSTPAMFSRSSRRSGFVSSMGGSTSSVTNGNANSANNTGTETTLSAGSRSSTTSGFAATTTSRLHRGSVLSRFFRRNQDSNNNN